MKSITFYVYDFGKGFMFTALPSVIREYTEM